MSEHKIGTDEWVEQYQQRIHATSGIQRWLNRASQIMPVWAWVLVLVIGGIFIPTITDNQYILRVIGNIGLMATLAIGLNVVVGYAGLLDLGFVAFYGIGAYAYAYMSSDFSGLHLPAIVSIPIVMVVAAGFGFLLGLPSLRLVGDYLAIVTLGFGLVFEQLMISLTRVQLPGMSAPVNLTGGPNGIVNLDSINAFGIRAAGVPDHFRLIVVLLGLVLLVIYHLNTSRFGRAWRSMREDELAAEAMGIPTRQLKLLAFAIGAAVAGTTGSLFAAWQGSVFPGNFDTALLIILYAIVVLGGLGSLPGVVLGAVVLISIPEILRNPVLAGALFYIGVLALIFFVLRPRWQAPLLVGAVIVFGIIVRALVSPELLANPSNTGALVVDTVRNWLAIPRQATVLGNQLFISGIILGLAASRIKHIWLRFALLIPTVYIMLFVWETRLSQEPSVSRLIFVGVLLVVMMINRPQGLLGTKRVEIV